MTGIQVERGVREVSDICLPETITEILPGPGVIRKVKMVLRDGDILFLVIVLLCVDLIIVARLFLAKALRISANRAYHLQRQRLAGFLVSNSKPEFGSVLLRLYNDLKQSFQIDARDSNRVVKTIMDRKIDLQFFRKLKSRSALKRIEATTLLGSIATDPARIALEDALAMEKNPTVKLYLANALADIGDERSIPHLVSSLMNTNRWYRQRVNMLIINFGDAFHQWIPLIMDSPEPEFQELVVEFAGEFLADDLRDYLLKQIDEKESKFDWLNRTYPHQLGDSCGNCVHSRGTRKNGALYCPIRGNVAETGHCSRLRRIPISINSCESYSRLVCQMVEIIGRHYPHELNHPRFLYSSDPAIKKTAIRSLANIHLPGTLQILISFLKEPEFAPIAISAVKTMIERDPAYLGLITHYFEQETDRVLRMRFAEILSSRVEYFIPKLNNPRNNYERIIREILRLGKTKEIIGFLNRNRDPRVEAALMPMVREAATNSQELAEEFGRYLHDHILERWNIPRFDPGQQVREEQVGYSVKLLYVLFFATLFFFPMVFAVLNFRSLWVRSPQDLLKMFIIDFNYFIAYYSIFINSFSLLLMFLSLFCVRRQLKLWNHKQTSMLFKRRMLPSISVVAPAFNEEPTIIESTNSLLNLRYPDYDLIIVNDGSRDQTLGKLIDHFHLERVEYPFEASLKTMPVRGIYINRHLPKLIVVDKENGGKADSLNAGINISTREYLCGIDADSLLEENSLLKLASMTIDQGCEVPALGGSVYPINDCRVDQGKLVDFRFPRNKLARLQMIEYMCSFMPGRLGWSMMNALLIISGAFGLFRKERVIEIGGYLTSRERYQIDTVGEDMELVARISRTMRARRLEHRICYSFNANCWTEVPETLQNLKRQRSRWQRGLIEVLMYHRDMLFNRKYGTVGMIAVPYFYIFETYGPIIELMGYVFVFLASVLGLLNFRIMILLFFSSIMLRILVSLVALLIAEKDKDYYSYRDIWQISLFAILDSLGPRQLFGFWRVTGYLHALRKQKGWQKFERQGFVRSGGRQRQTASRGVAG